MSSDFLQLAGKTIAVFGIANRKSVAWHIAQVLTAAGARVAYVVRSEARREAIAKLLVGSRDFTDSAAAAENVFVCDVEFPEQITRVAGELATRYQTLHGMVHSIAFADYSAGPKPFHETPKQAFLRSVDVSCFSLLALANALKDTFDPDASVVAISISTTRMASENYGYMAPIKAALDSSLAFLAKSFSGFSRVRFNAVAPGLLKTSASAGIPNYVDSYLFAELATLRRRAVQTEEAARVAAFLLSPASSGINAQQLVVDAGMSVNYFDHDIVSRTMNAGSAAAPQSTTPSLSPSPSRPPDADPPAKKS